MTYPARDTNWMTSIKGNLWKRTKGKILVVGKRSNGTYWAMRGGEFLKGSFTTEESAKNAAEFGGEGDARELSDTDNWEW